MKVKRALWALAAMVCLNPLGQAGAGPHDSRREPTTDRGIGKNVSNALPDWANFRNDPRLYESDHSLSQLARRVSTSFETPTVAGALSSQGLKPIDSPAGRDWAESPRILNREPRGLSSNDESAAAEGAEPLSIPEPASLVLLVTGLVGLTARRHIRRQRQRDSADR